MEGTNVKLPDGTSISIAGMKRDAPAPTDSAMSRASAFAGGGPSPSASRPGPGGGTAGFPLGLNFNNMVGFARTPAGQDIINRIMEQIRTTAQNPQQRRRRPMNVRQ